MKSCACSPFIGSSSFYLASPISFSDCCVKSRCRELRSCREVPGKSNYMKEKICWVKTIGCLVYGDSTSIPLIFGATLS